MYTKELERRRERRDYKNYYKKDTHQREYIAQVGKWLGYTFTQMKDHFIYPGINKDTFGTCRVNYRHRRWCIDEIPYSWDTRELLRELIRIEARIKSIPDAAYRGEAKMWFRGKIFKARVLYFKGMINDFIRRVKS